MHHRSRTAALAFAAALALAAPRDASAGRTRAEPAAPPSCFRLDARWTSKASNAVFKKRHLQAGGPTWTALLTPIVKGQTTFLRESTDYSPDMPHFGVPVVVTFRGAQSWYILDDEGDSATFCAGDAALLETVHAEAQRLNQDQKALEEALDRLAPEAAE